MADPPPCRCRRLGRLVIRNIGLVLSGDLARPILDADTLFVVDGRITGVGRAADLDTERRASSMPAAPPSPPG